jgi:hypothetical protein
MTESKFRSVGESGKVSASTTHIHISGIMQNDKLVS